LVVVDDLPYQKGDSFASFQWLNSAGLKTFASGSKGDMIMGQAKVAISIDDTLLIKLDNLVSEHLFPNRSRAIQEAVQEKLERLERSRLARECANLNPAFEKNLPKKE